MTETPDPTQTPALTDRLAFTVNAAGDGVNFEVDQKSRVRSIEVVGGDRVAELGLATPAVKLQWDSPDTFEVAPPKRITSTMPAVIDVTSPKIVED